MATAATASSACAWAGAIVVLVRASFQGAATARVSIRVGSFSATQVLKTVASALRVGAVNIPLRTIPTARRAAVYSHALVHSSNSVQQAEVGKVGTSEKR